MITVISPAKTLNMDFESDNLKCSTPELIEDADYLMTKLKKFSAKKIGKLMHLSDALAETNYERNQAWKAPHNGEAKPCLLAFGGDVYRGMDAKEFDHNDIQFAQDHLRILSGLYGALKPMDAIMPYRLEMGASLKVTPSKNNLYKYWGGRITENINSALKESGSNVLINLASNEYFKAIKEDELHGDLIHCIFKEKKGSEYKVVMTYAKLARGYMSRFIIKERINEPEALKDFNLEGYAFNKKLTEGNNWIFTR